MQRHLHTLLLRAPLSAFASSEDHCSRSIYGQLTYEPFFPPLSYEAKAQSGGVDGSPGPESGKCSCIAGRGKKDPIAVRCALHILRDLHGPAGEHEVAGTPISRGSRKRSTDQRDTDAPSCSSMLGAPLSIPRLLGVDTRPSFDR